MNKQILLRIFLLLFLSFLPGQSIRPEGYYKQLFMDGGVALTSRTTLPAADSLRYTWEYLATSNVTTQNTTIITSVIDPNGILLYPDNSPRFAMIYTNGGQSTDHGTSLGEEGRETIRKFYAEGGSYTGTCAGAFIASVTQSYDRRKNPSYYWIWPGCMTGTNLLNSETGHFIESGSALLDYYDFGGDSYIAAVRHNGGGYADTVGMPEGTEILLRYDYTGKPMHRKPSCWAYKASPYAGRIVVIGSHPEGVESGERLDLMKAILQYAADGKGIKRAKADLKNNIPRTMFDNRIPCYEKIGDRQYHHFRISVPSNAEFLNISLNGMQGYSFNIYACHNAPAFNSSVLPANKDITKTSNKMLSIDSPEEGEWFIGVELDTTVISTQGVAPVYSGAVEVLDGLPYTVTASYDNTIPLSHTISASAGLHGSIAPSGIVTVLNGASFPFLFSPDSAYEVDQLVVNGIVESTAMFYEMKDINQSGTINVSFRERVYYDTIIVDNGNSGTSKIGTWTASGGLEYYGTQSLYTGGIDSVTRMYIWSAAVIPGKAYSLNMWWTTLASRLSNVPVVIFDGDFAIDTIFVNQKEDGGKWNLLKQAVTITSDSIRIAVIHEGKESGTVCADAICLIGNPRTISGGHVSVDNQDISSQPIILLVGPNPFNPVAKISFSVPIKNTVELAIYNVRGALVRRLLSAQEMSIGRHAAFWNSTDDRGAAVSSGLYVFRLRIGETTRQFKATLIR